LKLTEASWDLQGLDGKVRRVLGEKRTLRWSMALTLLPAAGLLFLAFRGVNWRDLVGTVQQARLEYLALAIGIGSVSYLVRGLRWRVLICAEKSVALATVFWAMMAGYLGNSFLPARAGEVFRAMLLGRNASLSKSFVLATALTERMLDVIALVLISLAVLLSLRGLPTWLLGAVKVMGALGLVGLFAVFFASRLENFLRRRLIGLSLPVTLHSRLMNFLEQFLLGVRAFQHPGRALGFVALTAMIWLADALGAMVIAQSLSLSLALPQALLLLVALGLASAVPSTPGYVGLYQFVAVTVLVPFGFSQSEALAYILVLQAVTYLMVSVGGGLGWWRLSMRDIIE
jgi:glycosyltransferase 2 family protein